ncbi:peptide deformylase 1B, chloroplastic-like [Lolium rigidum]|uniref:peptide deformylase 1B, chloroplastic-like n=1 Tax=Lolium rigidum TaxID=89674 RepID=UPI001F5E3471|nr:peptide deformylase 1B, chloroplastic-like [Lolium rigidum]XP_047055574.1 peptide deformylase 1B, chloroplastic-like [Lolium rigidum]
MAAARVHLHLCPRLLRAFASSTSRPLVATHARASPLRRTGPARPLAARNRRGAGSSMAAAPPAVAEDFATAADLQFEAPLKIVLYPDPVLRARNKRINTFDANLRSLADEMFDVMYKTDGIGLSAPQVGVNVQLMVFNEAGVKGEGQEIVLVNPEVYKFSKRLVVDEEGCLSFPGIYANVLRPDTVKINAQDVSGAKIKVKLSQLSARVFQHEFDHLLGILFFDRMTMDVVESIRKQLKDLEDRYVETTGQKSPETVENYRGAKDVISFSR